MEIDRTNLKALRNIKDFAKFLDSWSHFLESSKMFKVTNDYKSEQRIRFTKTAILN